MHATGFATLWIFQLQLYGFLFCNFLHFLLATNTSLFSFNDLLLYICSPPDGIVFAFEQQILYQIEGYFSNVRKILYVIKGRWMDNVFIERLWKSVKYEDVYLKAYSSMEEARRGLCEYFKFYNEKRWHQNFDRKTPGTVHLQSLAQKQAVA